MIWLLVISDMALNIPTSSRWNLRMTSTLDQPFVNAEQLVIGGRPRDLNTNVDVFCSSFHLLNLERIIKPTAVLQAQDNLLVLLTIARQPKINCCV